MYSRKRFSATCIADLAARLSGAGGAGGARHHEFVIRVDGLRISNCRLCDIEAMELKVGS